MKKKFIIPFLLAFFSCTAFAVDTVPLDHFMIMPCINGSTGYINNPSAYSLPYGNLSIGLHNFTFKATYGVYDIVEAGIYFDFGGNSDIVSILKSGAVNIKVTPLNEKESLITLAAGIERFPFDVFDGFPGDNFKVYSCISKNAWDTNFSIGAKKSISSGNLDVLDWGFMADVSRVINDTVLATLEYDGHDWNISAKISLNYNISMEVTILSFNTLNKENELGAMIEKHFVFGIVFLR